MRIRSAPAARLAILACVAAVAFTTSCSTGSDWPADAAVRAKFEQHKASFERLVAMSNEESKVWQITPKIARVDDFHPSRSKPREATENDLPNARHTEYKKLFSSIGLPKGLLREKAAGGAEQIYFAIYSSQAPGLDSIEKGVVFSAAADLPEHAGAELTLADAQAKKPWPIFKRIGGSWYLYARYNE